MNTIRRIYVGGIWRAFCSPVKRANPRMTINSPRQVDEKLPYIVISGMTML
jgi:hypothetical protein